jgi:hypothetical protein
MRQIAQTIQRGQGGQCAAPQIESRAIADLHTSRFPHTFGKRGHPSTWICVRICKALHLIRTALKPNVVTKAKDNMMRQFECDDVGKVQEFLGNKIEIDNVSKTTKFTQPVLHRV